MPNVSRPLDPAWLEEPSTSRPGPQGNPNRRLWKPEEIVPFLDLTRLESKDGDAEIYALCQRATRPIPIAALCVYPAFLPLVTPQMAGSPVKIAVVSGGFPHGLAHPASAAEEIRWCVAQGSDEIDVVLPRHLANEARWQDLHHLLTLYREACAEAHLKVILSTAELSGPDTITKTTKVAMASGADFIKTSTGKEGDVANLDQGSIMCRAIQDFHHLTGTRVGLKAAGGIRTFEQATEWCQTVEEELGPEWLNPNLFRIGASALLDNLLAQSA